MGMYEYSHRILRLKPKIYVVYIYTCVGFCVARFDKDGQCETPRPWDE